MVSQKAYYYKKKKGTGRRKTSSNFRSSSRSAYYRGLRDGSVNVVKSLIAEAKEKAEMWEAEAKKAKTEQQRKACKRLVADQLGVAYNLERRLKTMRKRK